MVQFGNISMYCCHHNSSANAWWILSRMACGKYWLGDMSIHMQIMLEAGQQAIMSLQDCV